MARARTTKALSGTPVAGRCLCGAIELEIGFPAFWAWHDHSRASRQAHGAAYATYIGCWRKNVRVAKGQKHLTRFEDKTSGTARSFCACCGTPLIYERSRSPHMINLPRALFASRTGREPRYHLNIEEMQDWAYAGEPLVPVKGYPGLFRVRPKSKNRKPLDDIPLAIMPVRLTNTPVRRARKRPPS